jgi:hypothetical protein
VALTEVAVADTSYQSKANYTCSAGYLAPQAMVISTCLNTGLWSDVVLDCQGNNDVIAASLSHGINNY